MEHRRCNREMNNKTEIKTLLFADEQVLIAELEILQKLLRKLENIVSKYGINNFN